MQSTNAGTIKGNTMNLAILLIPSLIVVLIMKFKYHTAITTKELLIHTGICFLAAVLVLGTSYLINYSQLRDVEILNGQVTEKYSQRENCTSQSSSCKHYTWHERCWTTYDSKGRSQRECESYKVFDYPYEIDWYVKSTVGKFEIERVNRQGTQTPPRWQEVKNGDYAAAENTYINYLFADKHSLFSTEDLISMYDKEYLESLPEYPSISDYYKTHHVINKTDYDVSGYDEYLREVLKTLGAQKQVNIQVLVYDYHDVNFVDAVTSIWRGGKKNDVIMFFGISNDGVVKSFNSTSFAKGMNNEELHSKMRMDALNEVLTLDLLKVQVHNIQTKFERLSNKEFEYMAVKMEPRKDVMIAASLILIVLSIVVGLYMKENNV